MAKLNPPECFPFDRSNQLADWKQRFQRFRSATKLDKEDGEVQVSSLTYAMGNKAEHIFKSNVIYERACFY